MAYLYARMWYGRRTAWIAAAALVVLPIYFATGFIATMDAPLVLFWMMCLAGISIALRRDRPIGWYLAGAALGAAILSKYTGVFLGIGGVFAVVGWRPYRKHLRTIHPYLAALLALAIFSPVIVWNAKHDWASFRFQLVGRFANQEFGLANPLEFIGEQFAVATPVLLIGTAWLWTRRLRRRGRRMSPREWMAIGFSMPLLLLMAYKSLRYPVHISWTMPAYLSLIPAIAHLAAVSVRDASLHGRKPTAMHGILWTAAGCLAVNVGLMGFLLVAQPLIGRVFAFGQWRELAAVVEEYEDRMETQTGHEPLIVADGKYRLASVLAFYRHPIEHDVKAARQTTSQWVLEGSGLGFEYWIQSKDWLGKHCLVVDFDNNLVHDVRGRFEKVDVVTDPRLKSLGYEVGLCYGYKGPRVKRRS
jgi:dolichol-phosphate mannosyltransferase